MSNPAPSHKDAWRRLMRRVPAKVSLCVLAAVVALAVIVPALLPAAYHNVTNVQFAAPSAQHPFGTDLSGHDVFYRVFVGARISLLVGLAGAGISLFIGTAYGLVSGYVGGKTDERMMRAVEILYSFPRLIVIIVAIGAFDSHLVKWLYNNHLGALGGYSRIIILIFALGVIEWLTMARIVRGQVLSLKSQQFVAAARSLGQSHAKIILRHLLPNLTGIVIVYLTLTIPAVIIDESFLSFLGLGLQEPQVSWGLLLADAAQVINPIHSYWWLLLFPAVAMSATLLSFNFLGDALRDVLDPRGRR
ncbi:MAG TPA: ABC transporter permease [Chthoniobacteraceae bacterium]|nr:ABC transporter permease [Chthoniobacteraceae bacterium]